MKHDSTNNLMNPSISTFENEDNQDLIQKIKEQIKTSLGSLETLTTDYSEHEPLELTEDVSLKDLLLQLNQKLQTLLKIVPLSTSSLSHYK